MTVVKRGKLILYFIQLFHPWHAFNLWSKVTSIVIYVWHGR